MIRLARASSPVLVYIVVPDTRAGRFASFACSVDIVLRA